MKFPLNNTQQIKKLPTIWTPITLLIEINLTGETQRNPFPSFYPLICDDNTTITDAQVAFHSHARFRNPILGLSC
jgi:hypothetical protein